MKLNVLQLFSRLYYYFSHTTKYLPEAYKYRPLKVCFDINIHVNCKSVSHETAVKFSYVFFTLYQSLDPLDSK
jgi:hypothetical protein